MSNNPLTIIKTDDQPPKPKKAIVTKTAKRTTAKAILDRLWLTNPEQFNPLLNSLGRERIKRTCKLITEVVKGSDKSAADMGTGTGYFSRHLAAHGLIVHAVELSSIPFKNLENENLLNVQVFQDYIPHTTLEDDAYDLVLGTDVIAYLDKIEHRLFFAELARLVNADGFVIVSTPLDIYSEDALQNFVGLVESEFNIEHYTLSYHSYFIRLCQFFEAPAVFARASKDLNFYEKELAKRFSINRYLFKFNTAKTPSFFWYCISFFTNPILNRLKNSEFIMLKLETLCRFISDETGISHAIFAGKRRKLLENIQVEKGSLDRKGKNQVWE